MASPWHVATLDALLALDEFFLLLIEFTENILHKSRIKSKQNHFQAKIFESEMEIVVKTQNTYVIFNCFLDFRACFIDSRIQERSKVLCTLCNFRCDCVQWRKLSKKRKRKRKRNKRTENKCHEKRIILSVSVNFCGKMYAKYILMAMVMENLWRQRLSFISVECRFVNNKRLRVTAPFINKRK